MTTVTVVPDRSGVAPHPMADTYAEVEKMLYGIAHAFRRQYGDALGDLDDVLSEAKVAFAEVYHDYDPALAQFGTWLTWKARGRVMDKLRSAAAKYIKHPPAPLTVDPPAGPAGFDPTAFAAELSDDAAAVVRAIFEMPADVAINLRAAGRRETPERWCDALYEYFRDLGWAGARVVAAFTEIGEALP